jgi:hypothetical protein
MGWQGGINSVSGSRTRGRAVLKRTVKSCGPDASEVGVKSVEGKSARPGADEPAIRRRRGQTSPIPRGERDISRKAIAQGMSDVLRCPVCSCAVFYPICTRDRGCSAHPAFPAPSFVRDNDRQTSGASRRENAEVYLVVEVNRNSHGANRCSSDLVIFRYRSGMAADNNSHRYIPQLLRAAADVCFDPEATRIARAIGDTRTSRFSPRPEAV